MRILAKIVGIQHGCERLKAKLELKRPQFASRPQSFCVRKAQNEKIEALAMRKKCTGCVRVREGETTILLLCNAIIRCDNISNV